eukprot:CAMPEP_0113631574 /NCGR_PEP_ID=MMETSP0017_2-20120614/16408_1 /TAXON_ID=2856 /ORGANISM="Cylindrotheca closterium" /LENGTH=495 /DNA_ID=CAMNT_0000542089 /DNA_START=206 /DNA_END=1693 /DNA_ORIENTATION=- /assembly_acc=CAM_ASM_000147
MVPINYQHAAQESHLRRLEQQQQQQQQQLVSAFSAYAGRPIWIPSMVSVPASEPTFLSCQPLPPCPPTATAPAPVAQTTVTRPMATLSQAQPQAQPVPSADEVCAASVLISFTPKDKTASSNVPSPVPSMVDEAVVIPKSIREQSPGHVTDSCTSSAASASASVIDEDPSVCHSATAASTAPIEALPTYPPDQKWHSGCISLSLPEDEEVLSPLHCFMRRYCVEAFTAAPEDVATPRYGKSHGLKVVTGQVGIRCMYCKHRPVGKRPERAVCYPSSLKNIYHSIETWQRRHSLVCPDIPSWVRQSMVELMESSKSRAGGRRQYWEDSATRLGMVDTSSGVRFIREPGAVETSPSVSANGFVPQKVVAEEDKEMITDYLFLLMDQMETCQFTEEDRSGGRSKIKNNTVGFPGMQCKHCQGKAGFGRYFPSSVNALALANSDRNINNHLQKCRRCPTEIKQELARLQKDSTQGKNRRGLRKLFFRRVWERIHGPLDA